MEAHAADPHVPFAEPPADSGTDPALQDAIARRKATLIRLFYTAVFIGVVQIVAALLLVLVVFQLAFALVTTREPHARLARFGDVLTRYTAQVLRYITYNEDEAPFPFADLPSPTQPEPEQATHQEAPVA